MSAPTQLTVSVDNVEYCRYEDSLDTITVSVVAQGGAAYVGEDVTIELVKARRSRDAVAALTTIQFNGTADPQEGTATIHLPDIVDQDLISLVRHGKYFIRATSVTNESIIGESVDFRIRVVSVERLKNEFLFGISLAATEIKAPKFQPQAVTGVVFAEVSPGHSLGFGTLSYTYYQDHTANATAAIGAGADGTVNITADTALQGSAGNAITVEVVSPAGTAALSATFAGSSLVVNLDVTGGIPNAAANTATLIAAAIDALANFTATASGTGADSISAAEGPTFFSGGLTVTSRSISWAGGPSVSITEAGTIVARSGAKGPKGALSAGGVGGTGITSSDFVCLRIRSTALLPTANTVEEILIDKKKIDDTTLCDFIDQSVAWLEHDVLAGYIEPTNVVTDRDPTTIQFAAGVGAPTPLFTDTDFDFLVSPLTYFVPRTQGSWVQIQTQFPQVLRVDSLFGSIANTRVIDIDLEWIEVTIHGGMIQLVPFNQEIAFDFIGLLWVNAIRGASELPNFWHFNMIAGLRDATADIREIIAKKAAIDALTIAGMALRPGVGSVSLSRDGVSESVSYTNTAEFGIYTGTINSYKKWIDNHIQDLKGKYRGPTLIVV